jgi:hypothetical protein
MIAARPCITSTPVFGTTAIDVTGRLLCCGGFQDARSGILSQSATKTYIIIFNLMMVSGLVRLTVFAPRANDPAKLVLLVLLLLLLSLLLDVGVVVADEPEPRAHSTYCLYLDCKQA